MVVRGFLRVDVEGLPSQLAVELAEKSALKPLICSLKHEVRDGGELR
jgi:hypothetical protein